MKLRGAAQVFELHHVDYVAGGRRTLRDACRHANMSLDVMLAALGALEVVAPEAWSSPALLVAHIVDVHHASARAAMMRLGPLAREAATARAELATVAELVDAMCREVAAHFRVEEGTLFPAILQLSRSATPPGSRHALGLSVRLMRHNHGNIDRLLVQLREVTADYGARGEPCASCDELFRELRAFETELHEHVHLENDVLLPTALA